MENTTTPAIVHGAWDATALCNGTHGGPFASPLHNAAAITCPECTDFLSPERVSRPRIVVDLSVALTITLAEAARRVTFTSRELGYGARTSYTSDQATEIERCITADVRAGK